MENLTNRASTEDIKKENSITWQSRSLKNLIIFTLLKISFRCF